MSDIKLDSDVPEPKIRKLKRKSKYPFEEMLVGQSFHQPMSKMKSLSCLVSRKNSQHSMNHPTKKDKDGDPAKIINKFFVLRTVYDDDKKGKGVRVFRTI